MMLMHCSQNRNTPTLTVFLRVIYEAGQLAGAISAKAAEELLDRHAIASRANDPHGHALRKFVEPFPEVRVHNNRDARSRLTYHVSGDLAEVQGKSLRPNDPRLQRRAACAAAEACSNSCPRLVRCKPVLGPEEVGRAEEPGGVKDGENAHFPLAHPVDHAIDAQNYLPEFRLFELWNDPARKRKLRKALRALEDAIYHDLRVPGCIAGNEVADAHEVLQCLLGPVESRHGDSRRFASACETT